MSIPLASVPSRSDVSDQLHCWDFPLDSALLCPILSYSCKLPSWITKLCGSWGVWLGRLRAVVALRIACPWSVIPDQILLPLVLSIWRIAFTHYVYLRAVSERGLCYSPFKSDFAILGILLPFPVGPPGVVDTPCWVGLPDFPLRALWFVRVCMYHKLTNNLIASPAPMFYSVF